MTTNNSFKSLLFAAGCMLGLAAPGFASDDPVVDSTYPTTTDQAARGVLGQNLTSLGFSYLDFDDSGIDANAINLTLNQGIRTGVDTLLEYNYLRTENTGLGDLTEHKLNFGGRAYTNCNGCKPFVDGGIGWTWLRAPAGLNDNSFLWFASVGAEFQVTPDLTLTPSVRLWDATGYTDGDVWEYGMRANYWATEKLGLTAKISRVDSESMEYGLGLNYRF